METGKRKFSRFDFSQIVEYYFVPQIVNASSTGLLQDFSCSGFCMITHHPIEKGQEIIIKTRLIDNPINAVARWCNNLGNAKYKVGLEFKK